MLKTGLFFWYFCKVVKKQNLFCLAELAKKKQVPESGASDTQGADLCWWWLEVHVQLKSTQEKIIYRISAMNLYGHLQVYGPKLRRHFMKSDCEGQWNSWSLLPWRWAQMSCAFIYKKSGIVILQTGHLLEIPGSIWSWQAPPYHDRCRQRERGRQRERERKIGYQSVIWLCDVMCLFS